MWAAARTWRFRSMSFFFPPKQEQVLPSSGGEYHDLGSFAEKRSWVSQVEGIFPGELVRELWYEIGDFYFGALGMKEAGQENYQGRTHRTDWNAQEVAEDKEKNGRNQRLLQGLESELLREWPCPWQASRMQIEDTLGVGMKSIKKCVDTANVDFKMRLRTSAQIAA